jgi:hypothetical protein
MIALLSSGPPQINLSTLYDTPTFSFGACGKQGMLASFIGSTHWPLPIQIFAVSNVIMQGSKLKDQIPYEDQDQNRAGRSQQPHQSEP